MGYKDRVQGGIMAYLKKRGRVYYAKWHTTKNGSNQIISKSLRTRHKDVAEKMIRELEKLCSLGKIDPFGKGFNPVQALKAFQQPQKGKPCSTMREAADLFYLAKQHLSPATVDAYKRAIEYFIRLNKIEGMNPKYVHSEHFEKIIFKPGIRETTRHFYFRHLRVLWNFLLRRDIVQTNPLEIIRQEMPRKREDMHPKMITEVELHHLFEVFDQDLARKKCIPEFDPELVQYWLKPILALYFYAGLRKHEAGFSPDLKYSGLKGENLIYEQGELSYIYLPPTKGQQPRRIPVCRQLRLKMNEYLNLRGIPARSEYVFIYFGGVSRGLPVKGDRVYRVFKHYLKLSGLPGSRTLHGMRHQAVSTWIDEGFHTAEAGYMAGHSSQAVTEKYTHLSGRRLKEKMDRIDEKNNEI